jgi:hypothetical protein
MSLQHFLPIAVLAFMATGFLKVTIVSRLIFGNVSVDCCNEKINWKDLFIFLAVRLLIFIPCQVTSA